MESKGSVLVIEDNIKLNEANCRALKMSGYEVRSALTLEVARKHLAETEPDIILLDVMLPDGDGQDFCGKIRETTGAHILFLTARNDPTEILGGLNAGGDDYITKPFRIEELIARIDAVMRRRNMTAVPAKVLKKGALVLDIVRVRALVDGEDIGLTQKQFALLYFFAQHENSILTSEYLYEQIWNQPMVGDDNAVKLAVSRLRTQLRGSGYTITNKRRAGYCFEREG